jgi:hypothetical protein
MNFDEMLYNIYMDFAILDSIREGFNSSKGSVIIAEKKQNHAMKIRYTIDTKVMLYPSSAVLSQHTYGLNFLFQCHCNCDSRCGKTPVRKIKVVWKHQGGSNEQCRSKYACGKRAVIFLISVM